MHQVHRDRGKSGGSEAIDKKGEEKFELKLEMGK